MYNYLTRDMLFIKIISENRFERSITKRARFHSNSIISYGTSVVIKTRVASPHKCSARPHYRHGFTYTVSPVSPVHSTYYTHTRTHIHVHAYTYSAPLLLCKDPSSTFIISIYQEFISRSPPAWINN